MNFDADDILIADALSDMENALNVPDLLPGVRAKLPERRRRLRLYVIAALIAAALLITGCAAAFGVLDLIGEQMHGLGFTEAVKPVEQSVTDEGVEFTVIAAQRYGVAAVLYVTARDTLALGRTEEDVNGMSHLVWASQSNVNASMSVSGAVQSFVRLVSYDAGTQTAAYEMTAVFSDRAPDTANVSLRGYSFGYEQIKDFPIKIDVNAAAYGERAPDGTETLAYREGGSVPGLDMHFGALGTIGDKLTVQLCFRTDGEYTAYLPREGVYLLDGEGNRYEALDTWILPFNGSNAGFQLTFDVSPEKLTDATLCFTGDAEKRFVGDWSLSIPLANGDNQRTFSVDINMGTDVIENAELTLCPVGFSLSGTAGRAALEKLAVLDGYVESYGRLYGTLAESTPYDGLADTQKFSWFYLYYSAYPPDSVTEIRLGRDIVISLD